MDALSILLLGAAISGITQVSKRAFPQVNPLLWVALLSVLAGYAWTVFMPMLPEETLKLMMEGFATAIAFFEVLKKFIPKLK